MRASFRLGGYFANQRAADLCAFFGSSTGEIGRGLSGRLGDVGLGLLDLFIDGTILRDPKSGSFGGSEHVKWFIHC